MKHEYKFSVDWFSNNIPLWESLFENVKGTEIKFLEIGCYEGRATTWLLDNVLTHENSTIEVIDTFKGSPIEIGMQENKHVDIYKNFLYNIEPHKNKVKVNVGESSTILRSLNEYYNMIYIDGSHTAPDVLTDAVLCHYLLPSGGAIIFDDYLWSDSKNKNLTNTPKLAIDSFYNIFNESYSILYWSYQVVLVKN